MRHSVNHTLSPELAKKALDKAFEAYSQRFERFDPSFGWRNDSEADLSFSVKGKSLNGTIAVKPSAIDIDLEVPLIFRMFQKQAIGVIEKEIRKWIDKAEAGELA